jgi:hypothetical protein
MPRSDYYEKQAEKLERYQDLAEKKTNEGNALIARAHQMAEQIPLGQPILVGHYSEKGDRNYRARINSTWDRGYETLKTAEHYERKVQSIESNRAISSDAPDAVELLRVKLQKLVDFQEHAKIVNKICRKKVPDEEKIKLLIESGLKESTAKEALLPDFCGRVGIPAYALTNNNGNMKRIKDRIAELEKAQTDISTETMIGDVSIVDSVEDNRIMIVFPGVPDEAIRARLKSDGFRWSPSSGAWQAYRSAAWKIPGIVRFLSVMPGYVNPSLLQDVPA